MARCEVTTPAFGGEVQCMQQIEDHQVSFVETTLYLRHIAQNGMSTKTWSWETRA